MLNEKTNYVLSWIYSSSHHLLSNSVTFYAELCNKKKFVLSNHTNFYVRYSGNNLTEHQLHVCLIMYSNLFAWFFDGIMV